MIQAGHSKKLQCAVAPAPTKSQLLLPILLATMVSASALAETWAAIDLAKHRVSPGQKLKFVYPPSESFESSYLSSPVFVARGARRGYSLCITAGIHGDELNGMEIARRAFATIDAADLAGTLVVFPSVNAQGARSGQRDMIDRRDLNRSFPGTATGSIASIVAYRLFELLRSHCHAVIDLHTGSNARFNLPQIRVTSSDERALNIARRFGVGIVALGDGPDGSLRREIANAGVPAILYEGGASGEFQEDEIQQGVRGIESILRYLQMLPVGEVMEIPMSRVYSERQWIRVPPGNGGYFFPTCTLGGSVQKGQELGYIIDPLTDQRTSIEAPSNGEIIGFATPQIVLSGYGLFHLAIPERGDSP